MSSHSDMSVACDEVPDYQGAVKRLTTENRRLLAEISSLKAGHAREVRQLKVQLWEGLAPEMAAAKSELRHWRVRALSAEARLAETRRRDGK